MRWGAGLVEGGEEVGERELVQGVRKERGKAKLSRLTETRIGSRQCRLRFATRVKRDDPRDTTGSRHLEGL
jgi:hypothetical protein